MSKLNMTILEEYIPNFDMICLSETKLDMGDEHNANIKGYSPIFHHRMGVARKSGWIALYIREEYSEHIQALKRNNHEYVIWSKLDKEILGFDLIIGTVYIPPVNSTYSHGDEFDILTSDIIDLNAEYDTQIMLIGDFNARSSNLKDFVNVENCVIKGAGLPE